LKILNLHPLSGKPLLLFTSQDGLFSHLSVIFALLYNWCALICLFWKTPIFCSLRFARRTIFAPISYLRFAL